MPPARDPIKKLADKIMEDDPRWNPRTMGNKRGTKRRIIPPVGPINFSNKRVQRT